MRREHLRHAALIALFSLFIGAFALLYLLLPKQRFSELEKRTLAQLPELSPAALLDGSFEASFEPWLSDHVPARSALVGLNAVYEQLSGRNGLNGVIRGKNSRLFAAPEALNAEAVARRCQKIAAFQETSGLPVDVMLIPESGYMLPEDLPALHAEYHDAALREAAEAALGGIPLLWPEDAFRAADPETLYYRTDHHYTSRGAYEACRLYAAHLGLSMPEEGDYARETVSGFYGSMYAKSGLWSTAPDELEIWRGPADADVTVSFDDRESADSLFFPEHLEEMDKYPVFLDGNHAVVTIETGRADGETLLILRDSFGHCFAPFAADCFRKIILVDMRYYRKPVSELAAREAVDRVLVLYGADTFLSDTNLSWLR